jgi:ribosome-associated protein
MARDIAIRGDMIRLGQLLKLTDMVDGGGEVKDFLAAVAVYVNGEREERRGRQLHPGDIVRVRAQELRLVAGPS